MKAIGDARVLGIDAGFGDGIAIHVDADPAAFRPSKSQLDEEISRPASDIHNVGTADLLEEFQNPGDGVAAQQRVPGSRGNQAAVSIQPRVIYIDFLAEQGAEIDHQLAVACEMGRQESRVM